MFTSRCLRLVFGAFALTVLFCGTAYAQGQSYKGRGELDVLYLDHFDEQRSELVYYFIPEGTRERLELIFDGEAPPGLRSGQRATIHRGRRSGNSVVVSANGSGDFESAEGDAAGVSGERRAVVLLVNFTDSNTPPTPAQAAGMMWTDADSIDNYYRWCSYGNVSFPHNTDGDAGNNPDVFGPFNINYSSSDSGCDYYGWANAAESAATQAGVDLSLYQHRVFVLPYTIPSGCSWAGVANLGCGTYCRAWIAGRYWNSGNGDIWAHELGHNLSLHHASIPGTGQSATYGDLSDVMGYGGVGLRCFNAAHYSQMGWTSRISTVSAGTYTLHASEVDPALLGGDDLQIIRIDRPDTSQDLYIGYRMPTGFDSVLKSQYQYTTQIVEHSGGSSATTLLASLKDGQAYTDPISGATIRQVSHGTDSASVEVGLDCSASSPAVNVSPSNQYTGEAGARLAYNVTLSNNDANCGPTEFDLGATAPSGWAASFSPASLNLDSGASDTAVLTLTSEASAADGSYTFSVAANDNDGQEPNHNSVSDSAVYTIDGTPPDPVNSLNGSAGRKGKVDLSWNAVSDNLGGSGINGYRVYRDGALIANTSSTGYTDSGLAGSTSYSYYATAVDRVGNESAPGNTVAVTTGNNGGGKGGKGGDGSDDDGGGGGGGWGKGGKPK